MKKLYLLLFLSISGFSQEKTIDSLVNVIAEANCISGYTKGIAGTIANEFLAFQELSQRATLEELSGLTSHENMAVRGYAFVALKKRNTYLAKEIADEQANITTKVMVINGCWGKEMTIGEFMKQALQTNDIPTVGYSATGVNILDRKKKL